MSRDFPPLLGRILALTMPQDRASFIHGDLLEEYGDRASRSADAADRWLRRQVLASVPRFLWQRAGRSGLVRLAVLVATTLIASLAILAWESQVAREVARLADGRLPGLPTAAVRTLYVMVQAVAFAAAGAALARFTFERQGSFLRNAAFRLTPLVAIMFPPAYLARFFGEVAYPWLFLVPWSVALTVALLAGARLAARD